MAPPRKPGPDNGELRAWREEGLTHQQMADRAAEKYRVPWNANLIAQRLHQAGLTKEIVRFAEAAPWKVRNAHSRHYRLQQLRDLEKLDRGLPLDDMRTKRATKLLRESERLGFVIAYNPAAADDAPVEEVFPFVDRTEVPPEYLHPKYPISTYDPTKIRVRGEARMGRERIEAEIRRLERQLAADERQEGQQ